MATKAFDLMGRILLMVGNGPSSWWLDRTVVVSAKRRWPNLTVAACNRRALELGADIAGAVDRASIEELLVRHFHRWGHVFIEAEAHRTLVLERMDPGIDDSITPDGHTNVHFFNRAMDGTGTGEALLSTLAHCRPAALNIIGFDGSADPRTRHQGKPGYRKTPTSGAMLDLWRKRAYNQVIAAVEAGRCGPVRFGGAPNVDTNSAVRRLNLITVAIKPAFAAQMAEVDAWLLKGEAVPCPS